MSDYPRGVARPCFTQMWAEHVNRRDPLMKEDVESIFETFAARKGMTAEDLETVIRHEPFLFDEWASENKLKEQRRLNRNEEAGKKVRAKLRKSPSQKLINPHCPKHGTIARTVGSQTSDLQKLMFTDGSHGSWMVP